MKKEVSVWHIIYLTVIFVILFFGSQCLCPIEISEKAFDSFTFASTITAIVLAAVSIVYSLRSESKVSEQLSGMRETETRLRDEINKLQKIDTLVENTINKAIASVKDDTSAIRKQQIENYQSMKASIDATSQPRWGESSQETNATVPPSNSKL